MQFTLRVGSIVAILFLIGIISTTTINAVGLFAQSSTTPQEKALQEALEKERHTRNLFLGSGLGALLLAFGAAFVALRSRKEASVLKNTLDVTSKELAEASTHLASTSQQLAEASQFRFQMLNIASHELKNPLVAIVNFAELLNEPDMTPSERSVIIGQATGMAERALGLITALLESHRLEIGQVRAHIGNVSLLPVLHSVVESYRELAKHKSIIIFNEYPNPSSTEIKVKADGTMMRQVLENILSNAVKFSPFNRTILVRVLSLEAAAALEIPIRPNNQEALSQNSIKQASKRVRIEIQDEGQGVSAEDMQKMFGLFTKLSARPTGGESTTGVGLSIVKRMVESMNGRVWCESELGNGATFVVEFLAAEA
ncbi:MAG: HAMP domain-containing histidine kinase [Ignavibacteria bacterium]|nr:HAMP domain-containing histidine kinase [Ignavibacteria bacterium]MBL7993123.1 HAMP domain-containing histidine kinase [Candidatus Kapabacteria bacterium]